MLPCVLDSPALRHGCHVVCSWLCCYNYGRALNGPEPHTCVFVVPTPAARCVPPRLLAAAGHPDGLNSLFLFQSEADRLVLNEFVTLVGGSLSPSSTAVCVCVCESVDYLSSESLGRSVSIGKT